MSRETLQESLSAVMDNQADELELRRVLAASDDPELRATWSRYQIARAVMHKELLEPRLDIAAAVSAALADDVRIDEAQKLISDGTIQSFEKLNEKALATRAGTITDTELEQEYGRYIYKVEIRDAQGAEWDIDLDATNAEILKNEKDS